MTTITTRVEGGDKIIRILKRIPDANYAAAKKAIAKATFATHAEVTKNVSGDKLERRTGALARSFQLRVDGSDIKSLRGEVGTNSIYAPIHEYGGTIRARDKYRGVPGGPYLNIPTAENKTPAGVQRMPARAVFDRGGYIIRSKRGKYLVMLNGMVMFSLVKQVKIPARLGMREAARNQVGPLLDELRVAHLQELRE